MQVKVKREFLWHGYGRTFVTVQVTVEARGEEAKGCQTAWFGRIMPFTDRFFSWQKSDSRGWWRAGLRIWWQHGYAFIHVNCGGTYTDPGGLVRLQRDPRGTYSAHRLLQAFVSIDPGVAPGGSYTDNAIGRLGVHVWKLTHSKAGSVKGQRHFHMLTNPEAHQRLVHRENVIPGRRESWGAKPFPAKKQLQ